MEKSDPDFAEFEAAKQHVLDLKKFLEDKYVDEECDGSVLTCFSCAAIRAIRDLELMEDLLDVND